MMADDAFRDELRRALLDEGFGPLGLSGPRRALPWLSTLSAVATRLVVAADAADLDALERFGEGTLGVELEAFDEEASSGPQLAGLCALDWPQPQGEDDASEGDLLHALESLVARVADRGLCVFDLPVDAARETRLLRLLEGMLCEVEVRRGAGGYLLARGLRQAPGRELEIEEPEPIDLNVLIYTKGQGEAANATILDLLFRQNFPPQLVLVLDDAGEGEAAVPDDLWGMAPHAQTQPGLLRTGGVGRAAALAQGLTFLEDGAVCWIEAGERLAANHGGGLLATLMGDEEADFVHAAAWRETSGAPTLLDPPAVAARALVGAWMRGPRPPLSALAWWHDGEALPTSFAAPATADAAVFAEELLLGLAEAGRGVSCPWPLVKTPATDSRPSAELRRQLRDRLDPGRLGLPYEAEARALRRVNALLDRARYLAEASAWDEALADLDAAAERGEQHRDLVPLGVAWELRRGAESAARTRAEGSAFARALLDASVAPEDLDPEESQVIALARTDLDRAAFRAVAASLFAAGDARRILVEALH